MFSTADSHNSLKSNIFMKIESGIWNEVPFSIAIYLCDDFSKYYLPQLLTVF